MITGTYNVSPTLASQPILQELYLECDTSAPVTINLFEIAQVQRQWDLVIYVSDATNNAGLFPITINCGVGNHFDQLGVNSLTLNVDGSAVELRIVSDTAWLASKGSSGSGGGGITNVTYQQLYNLILSKGLIEGAKYRLTDYKSVNFLNGYSTAVNNPTPTDPNFNPRQVYVSPTDEQIVLTAISDYQLSPIGISETFSGDIVEFQAYTNVLALPLGLFNGATLPDASTVVGFDLQWDGTNVFFNMPVNYPLLYGHYLYLYAEFDDGVNPPYYLDIEKYGTTPFVTIPDFSYGQIESVIETQNQIKIILPSLTLTDFNNYVGSTLYLDSFYEYDKAYGYVAKRSNNTLNVTAPFDWRGYVYRRFEVNLTAINPYLSLGYFGIGDDYLGQGTTGQFQDFKALPEPINVQFEGVSIIDGFYSSMDNTIFSLANPAQFNALNVTMYDNTFNSVYNVVFNTGYYSQNVVAQVIFDSFFSNGFQSNLISQITNTIIGVEFIFNNIRGIANSSFGSRIINNSFRDISNTVFQGEFINNDFIDIVDSKFGSQITGNNFSSVNSFNSNVIGNSFNNNLCSFTFSYNTFGNACSGNTITSMLRCTFGNVINNNNFGDDFRDNVAGNSFYNNTFVGNSNQFNIFGEDFHDNSMGQFFFRNRFTRNTYLNDFGLICAQNNFLESCFSNTIGNGFTGNTFLSRFESNDIGGNATDNSAKFVFVGNVIGDTFISNNINQQFSNNTTVGSFNNVTVNSDVTGVDFSLSTIVYQLGDKTIFTRSDNNSRISYVDATNTIIYNLITA